MEESEIFSIKNEDNLDDFIGIDIPNEVIKVIGVGGAGCNALNAIIESGVTDVDFIAANTDVAALRQSRAPVKIVLGRELTKGRGAGSNPEVGCAAAQESEAVLTEKLDKSDMVFITCGMGGGTGTGGAPVVAQIAKEKLGALVVAIVTYPFIWEGERRREQASAGIEALREKVDALIVVENDRIIERCDKSTTTKAAFAMSDEVLRQAVTGVTGLIRKVTRINVDFADVCTVMRNAGTAVMGVGEAQGEKRALDAVRAAMSGALMTSPMNGASSVVYLIESGEELSMAEMDEANKLVEASTIKKANIIWGQGEDPALGDSVRCTLIATGFSEKAPEAAKDQPGLRGAADLSGLTAGDVVSDRKSNESMFGGFGSGFDIPTRVRIRKK